MTVESFLVDEWLPAIESTVRASTLRSYRTHVEKHVVPHLGQERLTALCGATINAAYSKLLSEGRHGAEGGLSPATVRRVHAVLRKALKDAVRWQRIRRNPAEDADAPRQVRAGERRLHTWTPRQVGQFLRHVADDRLYPLWLLLATTGMRRGEAMGLRWVDTDLDTASLSIRQARVTVPGQDVVVSEPKTAQGRRSVELDPATVAALRAWRAQQAQERLAWAGAWEDSGLVFTREDGTPLHPNSVSKAFARHAEDAEVPSIRLHDLRHTWASLAIASGEPVKVVSERLGHSTVTFTMQQYQHVLPGMQREAAERMAALMLSS